jgi:hypothetical protein
VSELHHAIHPCRVTIPSFFRLPLSKHKIPNRSAHLR